MKDLIRETHRRSLWQVLAVYLGASWVVLQVVDVVRENMGLPPWVFPFALVLLLIGLPVMLTTAIIQGGARRAAPAGARASEPVPEAAAGFPPSPSAAREVAPGPGPADAGAGAHPRLFTWRNAVLGGIGALLLFAVVMGGYAIARRAGIGAAGTLVAKGLIAEGERLILAQFSGDSAMAEAATMAFRVDLSQSPTVSLADPAFLASVLRRMEVAPGTPLDEELAREAAVREGIKAVVAGDVARVGGGYVFTARVVAADGGQDLVHLRETAADSSGVMKAIDRLSRRVRERLGESLASIAGSAPLDRATTTSLEALRKYSQALQSIDAGDVDLGTALLEEAVALDSTFAMAWRKLAVVEEEDDEVRRGAATRAYELRDLLTERERYMTIGTYHSSVTRDWNAAITAYRSLLDLYPDDGWALNNLALIYGRQGQVDLAMEMLGRGIEVDPYGPPAYLNLMYTLYVTGQRDSMRAVLSRFAEAQPGNPLVTLFRAYEAAAEWGYAEAERLLAPLASGEHGYARRRALAVQSDIELVRGRLALAERRWRESREQEDPLELATWRAWRDLTLREDPAAAARRMDRAMASVAEVDTAASGTGRAYLYALAGRADEARRWLEADRRADLEYQSSHPGIRAGWDAMFEAALARGEGRYEMAVSALRDAEREFDAFHPGLGKVFVSWSLADAFDRAGLADSAIARYELSLEVGELNRVEDDARTLPRALIRLAELYDDRGDLDNAAVYYAKFVELWSDADPEFQPRVRAARDRLEQILRTRG